MCSVECKGSACKCDWFQQAQESGDSNFGYFNYTFYFFQVIVLNWHWVLISAEISYNSFYKRAFTFCS